MSDTIADMLCRIRNSLGAGHPKVLVPMSKQKLQILKILKREGFIEKYTIEGTGVKKNLNITLRYYNGKPVIHTIKRVSTPGRRHYIKLSEIKPIRNNIGIMILSTSKGIMTSKEALSLQTGGEVICKIW